jgi:ubiquinone/menaquinone biosynthesis C-methylase UbiE
LKHKETEGSEGTEEFFLVWQKRRRIALDVLACPKCHGALASVLLAGGDGYYCSACQKDYPVLNGIPHFIQPEEITGWNKRLAEMYDWASWGYRAFSRAAFAFIGMTEEQGRREITDRLEPRGGRVLEVSIGPGVNLPYLVGRLDVGEIFGLDISLGQLKRCREYVAYRGWDVQLQLGNAEQLPYQDDSFDSVFHVGGINFFNDKQKAIDEMIRVAKPGSRILISDEKEQAAKAYERLIPGFMKKIGREREVVVAPLALIPPEMENLSVFDVWKGWFYCIEFNKP